MLRRALVTAAAAGSSSSSSNLWSHIGAATTLQQLLQAGIGAGGECGCSGRRDAHGQHHKQQAPAMQQHAANSMPAVVRQQPPPQQLPQQQQPARQWHQRHDAFAPSQHWCSSDRLCLQAATGVGAWRALHTTAALQQRDSATTARQRVTAPSQPQPQQPRAAHAVQPATSGAQQRVPGSSWTSLPNLLSLSRAAMGPWVALCLATQQWPLAVGITAAAGATDWLDGHLARRLGHTSKLGSYLDPLADKLFVGAAVGSMGWLGMLPGWLAALVVGRDGAQIAGMFVVRLRMFGGTWPGARAFFDVDHDVGAPAAAEAHEVQHRRSGDMEQQQGSAASSSSRTSSGGGPAAAAPAAAPGGLPVIRPLLVSKANTALTMLLVCACMGHQWQGVPSQEVLVTLELLAASTTAASAAAYAWLHARGQLLVTPDAAEQA